MAVSLHRDRPRPCGPYPDHQCRDPDPTTETHLMDAVTRYLEQHEQRFVQDLMLALRIPSVSTDPDRRADCARCAGHLAEELRRVGMTRVEVVPTAGHPVVYAEWLGAPGRPTALLYGHYDVQPPEPLELWKTPPFDPTVQDG